MINSTFYNKISTPFSNLTSVFSRFRNDPTNDHVGAILADRMIIDMNGTEVLVVHFFQGPDDRTEVGADSPNLLAFFTQNNNGQWEHSTQELIAKGEESLDPYQFDYLLLCAKICGASHYNMQMKIIVESEKDFNKWINNQKTFSEIIQ